MEDDLASVKKKHKPTEHKERNDKSIDEKHKDKVDGWETVVEWMKKEKKKKVFRRKWWPLIPRGCYDWRNSNGNQDRDFRRHSKLALVEAASVAEYRQNLFEASYAACTLRSEFQKAMQGVCVDREIQFSDPEESYSTEGTWWYADMLFDAWTGDDLENPAAIDHEEHRKRQEREAIAEEHHSEYTKRIMNFQNLPALTATPDTNELHPTIAKLIEDLNNVCIIPKIVPYLLIDADAHCVPRLSQKM